MSKTALGLTREEWQAYRPGAKTAGPQAAERWERAWRVARDAADVLREQFGATRVVAFGSLAHRDGFTLWSDIDLAAWEIPPEKFFRAVGRHDGQRLRIQGRSRRPRRLLSRASAHY